MRYESLRQQMEMVVRLHRSHPAPAPRRFLCVEDLVLKHGVTFRRASQPPPVCPIPKACYMQSYRLATRKRSRWVYCEGYAIHPNTLGLAVQHAWVARTNGSNEAYDLAWAEGDAGNTAYIGIPFQAEFVRETHRKSRKELYSVLDTWWLHYPLVTGETAIEDVIWKG